MQIPVYANDVLEVMQPGAYYPICDLTRLTGLSADQVRSVLRAPQLRERIAITHAGGNVVYRLLHEGEEHDANKTNQVVAAVAQSSRGLYYREVAKKVGMSHRAVSALLQQLGRRGVLVKQSDGVWRVPEHRPSRGVRQRNHLTRR